MILTLSIIVALLVANGFFVAAEFALVKARPFRLRALAGEGVFGAGRAERMRANLEPNLAACQLGITMASLGLGWVGEPFVASILQPLFGLFDLSQTTVHTVSFLIGFVIFSSLHIVVGEQVPKTWAIRKAEDLARWCAYPLLAFYLLAYPLNWLLNVASASILSLFGVAPSGHEDIYSGPELQGMIEASGEHGIIEQNQATMLANLFAFDERSVGRVMIPRSDVTLLNSTASDEANTAALSSGHSRYPVFDGESNMPLGIVLVKELYQRMLRDGALPWDQLTTLAREPLVVPESLRIPVLFDTMRSAHAHMAFVVDEYGQFIGLVTLEDLIEEIVGDINDETDDNEQYQIETDDTGWVAHGLAPLANVERAVGLVVPDTLNANTLSGLLMQRLGRMPEVNDTYQEGQFTIEVRAVEDHRVTAVHIGKTAPAQPITEEKDKGIPPVNAL